MQGFFYTWNMSKRTYFEIDSYIKYYGNICWEIPDTKYELSTESNILI